MVEEATERLAYIVSDKNSALLNIFRLDDEEDSEDIELALLRTFLNCNSKVF